MKEMGARGDQGGKEGANDDSPVNDAVSAVRKMKQGVDKEEGRRRRRRVDNMKVTKRPEVLDRYEAKGERHLKSQ